MIEVLFWRLDSLTGCTARACSMHSTCAGSVPHALHVFSLAWLPACIARLPRTALRHLGCTVCSAHCYASARANVRAMQPRGRHHRVHGWRVVHPKPCIIELMASVLSSPAPLPASQPALLLPPRRPTALLGSARPCLQPGGTAALELIESILQRPAFV